MEKLSRHTRHINGVVIYLSPIFVLLILGALLNATNPIEAGPSVILVVFILIYVLIFSVLAAILFTASSIWRMVRPQKPFVARRWYYVLSVISLAPVLFVGLNTLGQLEVLEISLILILVSLGCFYVWRRSAKV